MQFHRCLPLLDPSRLFHCREEISTGMFSLALAWVVGDGIGLARRAALAPFHITGCMWKENTPALLWQETKVFLKLQSLCYSMNPGRNCLVIWIHFTWKAQLLCLRNHVWAWRQSWNISLIQLNITVVDYVDVSYHTIGPQLTVLYKGWTFRNNLSNVLWHNSCFKTEVIVACGGV